MPQATGGVTYTAVVEIRNVESRNYDVIGVGSVEFKINQRKLK